MAQPPALSEDYYLRNFETVLRDVLGRYGDLLRPEEETRISGFLALPPPARRLLVRMLTRQGPWFRPDGFHYPEIPDVPGALAVLCAGGFCATGASASTGDLVALLRKDELGERLQGFGIAFPRALSRDGLAELLSARADPEALKAALVQSLHPVAPRDPAWVRLAFFLFFGNGDQDLTDFVLADTGRVRYEAYPVDPRDRLFQARADVDFLITLREVQEAFAAAEAAGDLAAMARITGALVGREGHPGVRQSRRFHRVLNEVGRAWERRKEPARALECYALSSRPPARERTARILAAQERWPEAARLAQAMAELPLDVAEEKFAGQWLRRLARRDPLAAAWVAGHPPPEPLPGLRLTVPRHPSGSVERAALEAAAQDGWTGFFTENGLWQGLFGLAFWDQLFAPLPGAFQHRFQSAPADIGGPDFHQRRREAIELRLEQLAVPGALAPALLRVAEGKRGISNAFVNWRLLTQELLGTALAVLPAPVVLSVLATMAPNPMAFRSGFPDLLLYRLDPPGCVLWEVKGPGDALRPEQERWLRHFNREGVEARVAWIAYG
jgi:hypothetical protein